MTGTLNLIAALLTVAFGLFGFLAPRYTASALDLAPQGSTMGLSELRASVGGLFVVLGIYCIASGAPQAYFALGVAYAGAALGRGVSLVIDRPPLAKAAVFFAIEAGLAAWLMLAN